MLSPQEIQLLTEKTIGQQNAVWFNNCLYSFSVANNIKAVEIYFPNLYVKEIAETRFKEVISQTFFSLPLALTEVRFLLKESTTLGGNNPLTINLGITAGAEQSTSPSLEESLLSSSESNKRYNFDNFIVGPSNQVAFSCCLKIASDSSANFNPLFIYSGVGLGKTHLLQALYHHARETFPQKNIRYVTCEKFVTDYVNSLRHKNQLKFFSNYRNECDILLIDDIQFLVGKKGSEEAFFHTFNYLKESGKQVVIASDRSPNDIENLELRLKTRFGSGLVVDIQPPNLETRLAITRKKADDLKLNLSDNLCLFLASKIKSNIRTIEGCLNKLKIMSDIENPKEFSEDYFKKTLGSMLPKEIEAPDIDVIIRAVAKNYQITPRDIKSGKRDKSLAFPRQVAMYLTRELTSNSFPQIGLAFGGKDHSTIQHGYNKIKVLLEKEHDLQYDLEKIKNEIL